MSSIHLRSGERGIDKSACPTPATCAKHQHIHNQNLRDSQSEGKLSTNACWLPRFLSSVHVRSLGRAIDRSARPSSLTRANDQCTRCQNAHTRQPESKATSTASWLPQLWSSMHLRSLGHPVNNSDRPRPSICANDHHVVLRM